MDIKTMVQKMTLEEKATLLTGSESMRTNALERLGIRAIHMADGPHGIRAKEEDNCTHFPNLCNLGSSWDPDAAVRMGQALADECIHHGLSMLLGPGINIKRHILCGRNFEYFSEDPVLAGEMAAGYIQGLQSKNISACLKHFAANNQEEYRTYQSAEIDERVLREIYLRGFEIAVKKAHPDSVMCAYNKINSIWCAEHRHLLTEILKDEWQYDGAVVSDWGAVHDICRSIKAGLDLQMPQNKNIVEQLQEGLKDGRVDMEDIDKAVMRVLGLLDRESTPTVHYDRDVQHRTARQLAAEGMVLLKNENDILPLTAEKYKKIAVIGEYAVSPLICGQGSAEVLQSSEYTDSPLAELKKHLPEVEFKYLETYKKRELSHTMLWSECAKFTQNIEDCDAVIFFAGSMESEDTEKFDRLSAGINPNISMFLRSAKAIGKKVVVVLQNGGALILNQAIQSADAIVEMWLAGEAAGGAVADILCAVVNPSGKLAETFPATMRKNLNYPGNGMVIEYSERLDVGYRYYDKHPEEILFPFGHGLSYTTFDYKDIAVSEEDLSVTVTLKNSGAYDGAEVVQLYVGDRSATVVRPIKELKQFQKVFLKAGEEKQICFSLTPDDLAYYNVSVRQWVAENGRYDLSVGASSRDIRLRASVYYRGDMPYTLGQRSEDMIG